MVDGGQISHNFYIKLFFIQILSFITTWKGCTLKILTFIFCIGSCNALLSFTFGVLHNAFVACHYGSACRTTAYTIHTLLKHCQWAWCKFKFKAPQNGYNTQEQSKF